MINPVKTVKIGKFVLPHAMLFGSEHTTDYLPWRWKITLRNSDGFEVLCEHIKRMVEEHATEPHRHIAESTPGLPEDVVQAIEKNCAQHYFEINERQYLGSIDIEPGQHHEQLVMTLTVDG